MGTTNPEGGITRRGFLELSSVALATAGIVGDADVARAGDDPATTVDAAKADPAPITGKIALEEHFLLPETGAPGSGPGFAVFTAELQRQLKEMGSGRIADMDRGGVELAILSNSGPHKPTYRHQSDKLPRSPFQANFLLADCSLGIR